MGLTEYQSRTQDLNLLGSRCLQSHWNPLTMPVPLIPLAAIAALSLFGVVKHMGNKINPNSGANRALEHSIVKTYRPNVEISSSMTVSLVINGVEYSFSFSPSLHGPSDLAAEFCRTKGREFLTDFGSCSKVVADAITTKIEKSSKKSDIIFDTKPLYNVKMPTSTAFTQSQKTDNNQSTTTVEGAPKAKSEAEIAPNGAANPEVESKTIVLEVNGINFVFEYPTSLSINDAAPKLAQAFCNEKADSLGIAGYSATNSKETNDAIIEKVCVPPLITSLIEHGQGSK